MMARHRRSISNNNATVPTSLPDGGLNDSTQQCPSPASVIASYAGPVGGRNDASQDRGRRREGRGDEEDSRLGKPAGDADGRMGSAERAQRVEVAHTVTNPFLIDVSSKVGALRADHVGAAWRGRGGR